MKTIYINGKFASQQLSGVQRVARAMVQALDEMDADGGEAVHWVLLCPPGANAPALRRIEVRFIGWHGIGLHVWEQVLLPLYTARTGLLNLSGSAPLLKRRQICTFHDAAVFDVPQNYTRAFVGWYRFHFRVLARLASLLLTVSDFSRGRLMHHLSVPAKQIGIVSNGADHLDALADDESVLERLAVASNRYFLVVGGGSVNKNLSVVAQALMASPMLGGHALVAVGGRSKAVFAAGDSEPSAAASRVLDAGAVTDAQLKALYRHAACLVFVSSYEGFGLPPLEAMACGCPVVASTNAAVPEVCGDAALYADPTSVAQVQEAMEIVVSDSATRSRLIEAGRARVRVFTWQHAASQLLALIQSRTQFT